MLRFGLNAALTGEVTNVETNPDIRRKPAASFLSFLGAGQIVSWGTLYYAYPLIAERISREMLLSKSEVYGAATAGLLVSACFAYPVGRAIDNGRGRQILTGGSLLAGLLLMIWSQLSASWMLYPIVLLLGMAQAMTLYEAAFAVIAKSSTQNQLSHSITKLTVWGGFASTIFVPLIEFLGQELGWRNALIVSGLFNFAVAGLYFIVIPEREAEVARRSQPSPGPFLYKGGGSGARPPFRPSFDMGGEKHSRFRCYTGLVISFTLYSLVFSGLSFHIYPLFAARKISPMTVAAAMALLGPAQVLGRLILWRYAKQISIARSARFVLLAFPVALLAMTFLPPISALLAFVVLYGIANGIMTIVRGIAIPGLLTQQSYGSWNSLIAIPSTISRALGPFALAYGFQRFGSFDSTMIVLFPMTLFIVVSYWYAVHSA